MRRDAVERGKINMTQTRKQRIRRRIFIGFAIFFAILAFYAVLDFGVGLFGIPRNENFYKQVERVGCTTQVVREEDGNFTVITDGELKILQLSDIHIGGGAISANEDTAALSSVVRMVRHVKPDLVVLSGDIVYPIWIQSGSLDNMRAMKMIANTMEALGVYWCPVFGNHDSEPSAKYTRGELGEYLEGLEYCLFSVGPDDADGVGNYRVRVKGTDGHIRRSLYFMDSGEYITDAVRKRADWDGFVKRYGKTKYDNIHENQIAWYTRMIREDNAYNEAIGAQAPRSFVFMHIPIAQCKDAHESGQIVSGALRESISNGFDYGFFERVTELGSTEAIFFGHDHKNDADMEYRGVHLCFTKSIDYTAYVYIKLTDAYRGGRVVRVTEHDTYDSYVVSIRDAK